MKIYYTSDVHGYLYPTNYADQTEQRMGLLKCIPNFKKDENTLIIDGGDMLQGSALATYCQEHQEEGFPQAVAMNQAGYDFVTLGNHDVNFGTAYLADYLEALDAQCLCENIFSKNQSKQQYPYTIKTLANGLKIGLVGVVTDYINVWEKEENIQDIVITDPFEAAKKALTQMKSQVDLTICIYHGGFERDVKNGSQLSKTTENIGYRICEELTFDLLLTGHQHLLIEGQLLHGTYIVQPSANAQSYFEIHLEKTAEGIMIDSTVGEPSEKADGTLYQRLLPIENKVQNWLEQSIGELSEDALATDKLTMALNGSPIVELIGTVQLKQSNTQITCVALANTSPGFHQKVTMRDVIATYPYTNQLVTLEITGAQLKEVLEKNAAYFSLTSEGQITISENYLYPKVEHYNYDFFIGITYEIDVRKALGERLTKLSYQGQPIKDTDTFTLSLGDYRASGGGGFTTYQKCPVVDEGAQEIVYMIVEYIKAQKVCMVSQQLNYQIVAK